MPALNPNVTAFLTQVKNDLRKGHNLDGAPGLLFAPGRNFCSPQDIANVLRLLSVATGNAGLLVKEILAIMNGKLPASQQYVGQAGGNEYLIIDAFFKLISYSGGTLPLGPTIFSTTALAGTSTSVIAINTRGTTLRIDEFRGLVLSVAGVRAVITSNTADGKVTISRPLATAPVGGEVVLVSHSYDFFGRFPSSGAGRQPGDNARLAVLIELAEAAVTAFAPTTIVVGAPSGSAHVGGAGATFTVAFTGVVPTGSITVPIVSSDPTSATVSAASLTFTTANHTVAQTVTVTGLVVSPGVVINVGPSTSADTKYTGHVGSASIVVVSP
jgi:hypothetical protein